MAPEFHEYDTVRIIESGKTGTVIVEPDMRLAYGIDVLVTGTRSVTCHAADELELVRRPNRKEPTDA